ncbi:hypothetical protein [Tenacibaculum sp. SZ-18]|uniref:hypothetical protein n=1 Tax=Tenacibaculum sp. SZ-18 TaxID=754423 RepID=UPI0018E21121|nr:hypothetical protein [Tenacibaculum sp. SZ-18]
MIDGIGAIVSAIFLGIILVKLEILIGIPKFTLYLLASFPCLFAVYDFYCYFYSKLKLEFNLTIIGVTNLSYISLSLGMAFYHFEHIKLLGWVYLWLEIIIVACLAVVQLQVAKFYKQT